MNALQTIGLYAGIFFTIILLLLFILNALMGGMFFTWLRVKLSGNKKVLVKVRGVVQDYYRAGLISEGNLKFKDLVKEERLINLQKGATYRSMGVTCVEVDDEKNAIYLPNLSVVPGFDSKKISDLIKRALMRPGNEQTQIILIILIICILLILITGYNAFKISQIAGQIAQMQTAASIVVPGA